MSRMQKKCLLASAGMHTVLVLLLVTGTAFLSSDKKRPVLTERLNVIPSILIDQAMSGGGGDPTAPKTDEQVKKQVEPPPQPKPPQPKPKKVEPKKVTPPPKETVKQTVKAPPKPRPEPKKVEIPKIEITPVVRRHEDVNAARERAAEKTRKKAQQQAAKQFDKIVGKLREGFEQGTVVKTYGPGGAAYANYAQFVRSVYEDAWVVSGDFEDEDSTATATIVIARDGTVISAHISRRSGNPLLDRSVQKALDKVKKLPPFPKGATEASRTFTINFNLKAKSLVG